jgi:hypothetical protein
MPRAAITLVDVIIRLVEVEAGGFNPSSTITR